MAKQDENLLDLNELLSRFYDDQTAGEFAEDMRQMESLLEQSPAAESGAELLADIKMRTETVLLAKKARFYRSARYRAAAVAAAFIILAAMSVKFFQQRIQPTQKIQLVVAEFVWDNGSENVEMLTAEIEELESDIFAFGFGEAAENGSDDIEELEMELMEIDTVFWKG